MSVIFYPTSFISLFPNATTIHVFINTESIFYHRKRDSKSLEEKADEAKATKQKRVSGVIEDALHRFNAAVKEGPDYVCTCCHRLMYHKTVVQFRPAKYTRLSDELLHQLFPPSLLYTSAQLKIWMCKTCDSALKRGNMPTQAKANNLVLEPIPTELGDLNPMEIRLISLRIPFMKMMALPCGKQKAIHGPVVNVPTDLHPVCDLLPRLPSQAQIVPMKLKRRLCYKDHYMYEYVRPVQAIIPSIRMLQLIDIGLEMLPLMIMTFGRLFHHSSLVSNPFPQMWSNLHHSACLLRMPLPRMLNNLQHHVLYSSNQLRMPHPLVLSKLQHHFLYSTNLLRMPLPLVKYHVLYSSSLLRLPLLSKLHHHVLFSTSHFSNFIRQLPQPPLQTVSITFLFLSFLIVYSQNILIFNWKVFYISKYIFREPLLPSQLTC